MNLRNKAARRNRKLFLEGLEPRCVLDGSPWHNLSLPFDVDDDGEVTTADESALSNFLDANDWEPVAVPNDPPPEPGSSPYYDVDDNWVVDESDLDAVSAALAGGGGEEEEEEEGNSPPVAYDSSEALGHNDTLSSELSTEDDDGDNLTHTLLTGPQHGTITLSAGGDFLYDPVNSYVGTDSFTYSVSDGQASDTATVTIQVANGRPYAYSDNKMGTANATNFGSVYALDSDGDPVTYSLYSPPSHGTVMIQSNGQYQYDPDLDYFGVDSFQFVGTDSFGAVSDPATRSIALQVPAGVSVVRVRDAIEGIQTGQFKFTKPVYALPQTIYFRFAPTSTATLDDPGTPPGDGDFAASHVPYSLTFAANQTQILVELTAYDDDIPDNEFVVVQILDYPAPGQGPVDYLIGNNNVQIAIKDPPIVAVAGVSVTEGDVGTTSASLNITISYSISQDVTVNYQTVDGTATVADNDYVPISSGSVVIPAGQLFSANTIPVMINGDDDHEPHEDFELEITSTSVAAVNIYPDPAIVFINNDDHVPVITSPGAQTHREGTTISKQIIVTDADTPASGLTLTVTGLPTGLSMSSSGVISGKIAFTAAGSSTVTVTATDSAGNQGTTTFSWTVTDAQIAHLVGREFHGSTQTSNSQTSTGASAPFAALYVSPSNVVQLIVGDPANLPPDPADILYSASGATAGNFASTPSIAPLSGTSTIVFVGIDTNQNGALDTGERVHALELHSIDFTGATIGAQRTSGPAEATHYTIKQNEHFEVGGTFDFSLKQGTGTAVGTPSLIKHEIWRDGWTPTQTGSGMTAVRTMTASDSGMPNFIRIYADANDNNQWNLGEASISSEYYHVMTKKVYEFGVWYSSLLPGDPSSTVASALSHGTNILLRKDSDDDWRAAVELRLDASRASHMFTAGGSYTWGGFVYPTPDPLTTEQEYQQLEDAAPDWTITVVSDYDDSSPGWVEGRAEDFDNIYRNEIVYNILTTRLDVLAHEVGHLAGLYHTTGTAPDPMLLMTDGFNRNPNGAANKVTQEQANAYDGP